MRGKGNLLVGNGPFVKSRSQKGTIGTTVRSKDCDSAHSIYMYRYTIIIRIVLLLEWYVFQMVGCLDEWMNGLVII